MYKTINNLEIFIYLVLILTKLKLLISKTIFIPFEEFLLFSNNKNNPSKPINFDKKKFLEENLTPKLVSNIKIGTPEKIIPAIFNIMERSEYIMPNEEYRLITNSNTSTLYHPSKSITFKNSTFIEKKFHYNQYYLINETIKLFKDIKLETLEEIDNFQIYLRDNLENAFSYLDISGKQNNFIIHQLKDKNIISSLVLSIKYISNYLGFISIGEYPHIYDNEHYFKEQFITFNFETTNGKYYDILTNKIFISWKDNNDKDNYRKEKKINFHNVISFYYNLNLIIASEEYMNLVKEIFFEEYIKKKICQSDIIPMLGRVYLIYTCNKDNDLDLSKFPSLNFNFYESNYIFELNYKDLFIEINNIYYFLVTCDYHIEENWKLGKPFLKKYNFIFDGSKKLAGFYDINKEIKDNKIEEKSFWNKKKIIIFFILGNVILIPIVYYFSKRLYIKRKLNAKELKIFYEDLDNQKISLTFYYNFLGK